MKHLGDITKINGYEAPIVDLLVGGSPCQDLSVAGKRAGLRHSDLGDEETTRSGLFMEQVRLIKEMRDNDRVNNHRTGEYTRCRWNIWENVPGALSSGNPKGADFQAVIQELCRVVVKEAPAVPIPAKGWPNAGFFAGVGDDGTPFSIAYRIHDSQYWGVPQRRRRIALLCDYGGYTAGEILFDAQLEREAPDAESDEAVAGT